MTSLRGGVSGGDAAGLELVRDARAHRHCELVAVHDDDPRALAAFRDAAGVGFAAASFDELLGAGVDFVVLGGPVALRLAQVEAAAAQGAHVLVRAPFAPDLATAAAMVRACERGQVRLGAHVAALQDPLVEQLRAMIAADWLGGVVAVQAIAGSDRALHAGDGPRLHPFVDLVSRHLHLTSWLTGRRVVTATAQTTRAFSRDDDGAAATAVLRGNVIATFLASHASAVDAFAVHGTDGGVRIAGDRLWLRGRSEFHGDVFDYRTPGVELALSRAELAPELAAAAPSTDLVGRFARWLDDTDVYPCPGEAALEDFRAVDALLRALRSGRTETVVAG